MSDPGSTKKDEFYRKYRQFLVDQGVVGMAIPHYVRHLEHWGRYLRRERGSGGSGSGSEGGSDFRMLLQGWLSELSGIPQLEDWQIRQAADAVRLAYAGLLKEPRAESVPWSEMVDSVLREREGEMDVPVDVEDVEDVEAAARRKGLDEGQSELVGRLVTRLRERHYAYRTEQTYREWAERLTTEIYTHVMNKRAGGVTSPLDVL